MLERCRVHDLPTAYIVPRAALPMAHSFAALIDEIALRYAHFSCTQFDLARCGGVG